MPFVDNSYAYNYPIKTSTFYTITPTYGAALNPAGGVVNFITGIPATPTVAVDSDGTLTESAANGTIGLANLFIPLNFKNAYVSSWNAALQQALPKDMSLQIAYVANHGTRIDVAQNINQPTIYGQSAAYDPFKLAFGKTAASPSTSLATPQTTSRCRCSSPAASRMALLSALPSPGAKRRTIRPAHRTATCSSGLAPFIAITASQTSIAPATSSRLQPTSFPPATATATSAPAPPPTRSVDGESQRSSPRSPAFPSRSPPAARPRGTTQTVNEVGPYKVTHNVNGAGTAGWFNPASFAAPTTCAAYSAANPVPCVFGNTGRNQFRGPGYFSDNLSLFKVLPIFRESSLEARIDAFNLTNTPAFGLHNSTLGSHLGQISSTLGSGVGNVNGVGGPRVLQAGVKIAF